MRNEFCILDMSLFYTNISVLVFLWRWNINFSIEQVSFWFTLAEHLNKQCFYKIDIINVFLILFHFALIGCPNFDVSMVYSWLRTWIINSDGIEKRYFPFQRVTFSVVIVICSTYQIVLFDLDEIITWLYWCCFKWKVWNKLHFENIYHSNFVVKWYQYFPYNI